MVVPKGQGQVPGTQENPGQGQGSLPQGQDPGVRAEARVEVAARADQRANLGQGQKVLTGMRSLNQDQSLQLTMTLLL